jgi:hypothetical protein
VQVFSWVKIGVSKWTIIHIIARVYLLGLQFGDWGMHTSTDVARLLVQSVNPFSAAPSGSHSAGAFFTKVLIHAIKNSKGL